MSTYWERTGASYEERLPPAFARLKRGLFRVEPINEETVVLAQDLAHDFPLALCSNALGDLREVLASRPDIRELFSAIVISAEVGVRKPNPAILELTAARLDLPRQVCLLVDDKSRNINAAAVIGMPGIVFDSPTQLRSQLVERVIWRASQA
jgi:HAD superfamily hydrolase (TIGR01509 family)